MDETAVSGDPSLPAFLSPPAGAPAYYGFPVVDGAEVEGFQLGMITDFLAQSDTVGDAYVIAPDDSRAGLVWESESDAYFVEARGPDARTWGVYSVGLPLPLRTAVDACDYLAALLPDLRLRWE